MECTSSVLAFSPQVSDSQGFSVLRVAPIHEAQKIVWFTPFTKDEVASLLPSSFDSLIDKVMEVLDCCEHLASGWLFILW